MASSNREAPRRAGFSFSLYFPNVGPKHHPNYLILENLPTIFGIKCGSSLTVQ
jgi:hypothetical protein